MKSDSTSTSVITGVIVGVVVSVIFLLFALPWKQHQEYIALFAMSACIIALFANLANIYRWLAASLTILVLMLLAFGVSFL